MRKQSSVVLLLCLIALHAQADTSTTTGSSGWPADHVNSLSDIRCRQWCTFRFREGSRAVFVGRDAEIRRFLIADYVKRTQDKLMAYLDSEVQENKRQFRMYYSRLGSRGGRQSGQDKTVHWFNLYHDYLHCLKDCFDA